MTSVRGRRSTPKVAAAPKRKAARKRPAAARATSNDRAKDQVNLTAFAAHAIKSSGPGPYELAPGRYDDVVGLPQVLAQLGSTPDGQAAVQHMLQVLRAKTGIAVSPEVQAALLSNPSGATTALELTPRQLSTGIIGLNAAYQAGRVPPVAPRERLLGASFELGGIAQLNAPRPVPTLTQVAPGLFTGSLPSTLPDAEVKQNRVMAEVLDRLSRNASAPEAERFSVRYQGRSYSRLDDFLKALKANGHEVKVTFSQRAANFADLKTPVPGSDPVKYLDVPAPLMLRTGIKDGLGKEAVLPAAHSEMIISITSGPNTVGPRLDSTTRYFEGIDGTGFFPHGVSAEPKWLGHVVHDEVEGDDAIEALTLAGALGDVIAVAAKDANLYADGYGLTGVCNDSVAVIQMAMTGRADQYPLFMRDGLLFPELRKRLGDDDRRDDPVYRVLRDAIDRVPSDVQRNDTLRERAIKSIPWRPGREPFDSTVDARRTLTATAAA